MLMHPDGLGDLIKMIHALLEDGVEAFVEKHAGRVSLVFVQPRDDVLNHPLVAVGLGVASWRHPEVGRSYEVIEAQAAISNRGGSQKRVHRIENEDWWTVEPSVMAEYLAPEFEKSFARQADNAKAAEQRALDRQQFEDDITRTHQIIYNAISSPALISDGTLYDSGGREWCGLRIDMHRRLYRSLPENDLYITYKARLNRRLHKSPKKLMEIENQAKKVFEELEKLDSLILSDDSSLARN